MAVAKHILELQQGSSFIRKMFEEAIKLQEKYGAENVYDYSLGNPYLNPPKNFTKVLLEEAAKESLHKYMPNAGYSDVRELVAKKVSREMEIEIPGSNLIMTVGAGGALNTALKAILNPGDVVLTPTPCFVEYRFYCDNHGGTLEFVETTKEFDLIPAAFEKAITSKTAAIILNSPNNPTGKVYSEENLKSVIEVIRKRSKEVGRTIYIITDEPYRKIIFDNLSVPSLMKLYEHTILCTSFSKDLSLPGERIGYLAVSPNAEDCETLVGSCIFINRILGYVNAPALQQRTVARVCEESIDPTLYQKKRDILYNALTSYGYKMNKPGGTFYLFPEAPGGDDLAFVAALQKHRVLAVPGRGFAAPGYFRLSYCVSDETIVNSLPSFEKAIGDILSK